VVSKSGDIYKKEDDSKEYQSLQEVALALGLSIRNLLPPSENGEKISKLFARDGFKITLFQVY
jgi:hypothetical protein